MDTIATRCLDSSEAPYWVANEGCGALLPLLESEPHAGQLYSVLAALNDSYELGRKSEAEAEDWIRRFAREWLDNRKDRGDITAFVDRWYYEECGYRPS
jgi:hypothetical protein